MKNCRKSLEYSQLGYFYRAILANSSQIISFEVDDHYIFCPVFYTLSQLMGQPGILGCVFTSWISTFYRPCFHLVTIDAEEPLR